MRLSKRERSEAAREAKRERRRQRRVAQEIILAKKLEKAGWTSNSDGIDLNFLSNATWSNGNDLITGTFKSYDFYIQPIKEAKKQERDPERIATYLKEHGWEQIDLMLAWKKSSNNGFVYQTLFGAYRYQLNESKEPYTGFSAETPYVRTAGFSSTGIRRLSQRQKRKRARQS